MYSVEDHKNAIGERAHGIIVDELRLEQANGRYTCPHPTHDDNNPSATWNADTLKFKCWSCNKLYDIVDHMKLHRQLTGRQLMEAMAELSGLETVPSEPMKAPAKPQPVVKGMAQQAIAFCESRGIGAAAIEAFGITGDQARTNFNCFDWIDRQRVISCVKYRRNDKQQMANGCKEMYVKGGRPTFFGLMQVTRETRMAIITEGLIDAAQLYQVIHDREPERLKRIAILSVPAGVHSLRSAWQNCAWLNSVVPAFVLIPDADEAGRKMLADAVELIAPDKLGWVDVAKLTGMEFRTQHGDDLGNFLDQSPDSWTEIFNAITEPPIEGCDTLDNYEVRHVSRFLDSGFLTHDKNDTGLKRGCLTVMTGRRGQGKTTVVRQMAMAVALQKCRVFCFFGESTLGQEKARFARLCAATGEIESNTNEYGVTVYRPSAAAIKRFTDTYQRYLLFYDKSKKPADANMFTHVIASMKNAARRGCGLFILDNMMMLCTAQGNNIFTEQKEITKALKDFALDNGVHVILVAHPKKGEGLQSVSGALEQENIADTLLYYVRMTYGPDDDIGIPPHCVGDITATLVNKKVRDEGSMDAAYLIWDKVRGAVIEITQDAMALRYEEQGYWTQHVKPEQTNGH